MLELVLIGPPILTPNGPLRIVGRIENKSIARRLEVASTGSYVHRKYASREDRAHDCAGNDIFLRLEKRFDTAVYGGATRHTAGNLRDHKARILHLGMTPVEFRQHFRHLLGRGNANVGNDAAM